MPAPMPPRPRPRLPLLLTALCVLVGIALILAVTKPQLPSWLGGPPALSTTIAEPGVDPDAPADQANATRAPQAITDPVSIGQPSVGQPLRNPQRAASALPDAPKPGESRRITLGTAAGPREVLLVIPPTAVLRGPETNAHTASALVLSYHGWKEKPEQMETYSGLSSEGAIVAYPVGIDGAWGGAPYARSSLNDDLDFTRTLLDTLAATYQIDSGRVFAAGMSNGGGFVAALACAMPQDFNALAAVSGAYYPGLFTPCLGGAPAPNIAPEVTFAPGPSTAFLDIHGMKDNVINYEGGNRHKQYYLPAIQFTAQYAQRAGCRNNAGSSPVNPTVTRVQWMGCPPGHEVTHLSVGDAGHAWPRLRPGKEQPHPEEAVSSAITATSEILAFFSRHSNGA